MAQFQIALHRHVLRRLPDELRSIFLHVEHLIDQYGRGNDWLGLGRLKILWQGVRTILVIRKALLSRYLQFFVRGLLASLLLLFPWNRV